MSDFLAFEQVGIIATDYSTVLVDPLTLEVFGRLGFVKDELTATATVAYGATFICLNHATVIAAATLRAPERAGEFLLVYNTSASGTAAHTATLPSGVTFDGTNDIATLNAPDEFILCIAESTTRYRVLINGGGVAFST